MSAEAKRRLRVSAAAVFILALALAGAACAGDGNDFLLDREPTREPSFSRTPTATVSPGATLTPRATTPPGTAVTPQATTPPPAATATPTATPAATTPGVTVTPVASFKITVKAAVNIRTAPTTEAAILGGFFPGDTKTVIGEARGQEAEPGSGNLWYALEEGGFVYAPLVDKVP